MYITYIRYPISTPILLRNLFMEKYKSDKL